MGGACSILAYEREANWGLAALAPPASVESVSRFSPKTEALVPVEGLEPPLPCGKQILSLSRLPFRHIGTGRQKRGDWYA